MNKYISGKIILITILLSGLLLSGCNKNDNQNSSDDLKKKELELKEKELQLKEKEMLEKKETELNAKEKEINKSLNSNNKDHYNAKINLKGTYSGSIKDGTRWYVYISNFEGTSFNGYNDIYWKKTPDGFKTDFNGTYNTNTREIIMYEDKNAKGSGKFIGTVSIDGNSISGDWYRYTDGNSFTWNLSKTDE